MNVCLMALSACVDVCVCEICIKVMKAARRSACFVVYFDALVLHSPNLFFGGWTQIQEPRALGRGPVGLMFTGERLGRVKIWQWDGEWERTAEADKQGGENAMEG